MHPERSAAVRSEQHGASRLLRIIEFWLTAWHFKLRDLTFLITICSAGRSSAHGYVKSLCAAPRAVSLISKSAVDYKQVAAIFSLGRNLREGLLCDKARAPLTERAPHAREVSARK